MLGLLAIAVLCAPTFGQQALGPVPSPAGNPPTSAKIALGKALFWEEQLSLTGTVACGTCHRPAAAYSDPRSATPEDATRHPGPDGIANAGGDDIFGSAGVPLHGSDGRYRPSTAFGLAAQVGARKSPPVTSAAYSPLLFWDGRARGEFRDPVSGDVLLASGAALESQSLAPMLDTSEMGHLGNMAGDLPRRIRDVVPLALASDVPLVLANWIGSRRYPALFADAFGSADITPARIAFALASYERALNATSNRFDLELAGTPALTAQERLGRQVFVDLECDACHAGALHSDNTFRYLGVRPVSEDAGRFAQTGVEFQRGQFRVPSLRDVGARAPYMHNGGLATLGDVVDFYVRGGDFDAPNKDPLMIPRALTPLRREALIAYMRDALTDPRIQAELPPFDRPTLFSESPRAPVVYGQGTEGLHGVPRIVALEPPIASKGRFTVALGSARAGAAATLVVGRSDPGVRSILPRGDFANVATIVQPADPTTGGYASVQLDLAAHPRLAGTRLFARFYVADPAAADGWAVSRAVRLRVFDDEQLPALPDPGSQAHTRR